MLCSITEKKELACYFYIKNNGSWECGLSTAEGNVMESTSGIMIEKEIHARKLAIVKSFIQ